MSTVTTGLPQDVGGDIVQKMMLGYCHTEVVNSTSADATPTHLHCRAISVDTDGVTKFDTTDEAGTVTTEVKNLKAGTLIPARNVTKVYRYYVGTTAVTTVYNSSGSLVNGLKLHW
jgi:hypothetical protein